MPLKKTTKKKTQLSQRDQYAKSMAKAYAKATSTGTLGVGFGGDKKFENTKKKVFGLK